MEFNFNNYGVCIDPEVIRIYKKSKYEIEVRLAEFKGSWFFGYDFETPSRSSSSGVCIEDRTSFNSRTEALFAAKKLLQNEIVKYEKFSDENIFPKKGKTALLNLVQRTLF